MSKLITFSRYFPKGHPKEGQPTGFVKSILHQQGVLINEDYKSLLLNLNSAKITEGKLSHTEIDSFFENLKNEDEPFFEKVHTIRGCNRFKTGEKFSPRVWSGKPYCSPQIIISPDIEIKKNYSFEIKYDPAQGVKIFLIDGIKHVCDYIRGNHAHYLLFELSKNDGLSLDDFMAWFKYPQPFIGQIICWDSKINY